MSTVSIPYDAHGRINQKRRTRDALVEAAREIVASGVDPTVEDAAARAGVSRTTAYRYFGDQRTLLLAAHPEIAVTSLLPAVPPQDAAARLVLVVREFTTLILGTEAQQRSMLRLSLEPDASARGSLPLRQGRAIGWIAEALDPLVPELGAARVHQLALSIRSAIGIEALVWLTDVAGLSREEAVKSMLWSAQAMLSAAVGETRAK
jgi:AcrR family transcriptional regulator